MWFSAPVREQLALNGLAFNFMPSWWSGNYGIEYARRMFFDPDYRLETYLRMERMVHDRFPGIPLGSPDPAPVCIAPELNNAATPAAVGCEVHYPLNNYPWSEHLSPGKVAELKLPSKFEDRFPYAEIDAQVGYLNKKIGCDSPPLWPVRGVLNDAALISGTDVFEDILGNTGRARGLFDFTHGVLERVVRHNHAVGFRGMLMIFNCSIMMVSPQTYEEWLLPYDLRLHGLARELGMTFGIHHCGGFDRYASVYRKIPRIEFIEIGSQSDVGLALERFPEATVQYIMNAAKIAKSSCREASETTKTLLRAAGDSASRFRLHVPDIEYGTPEENLRAIYRSCQQE